MAPTNPKDGTKYMLNGTIAKREPARKILSIFGRPLVCNATLDGPTIALTATLQVSNEVGNKSNLYFSPKTMKTISGPKVERIANTGNTNKNNNFVNWLYLLLNLSKDLLCERFAITGDMMLLKDDLIIEIGIINLIIINNTAISAALIYSETDKIANLSLTIHIIPRTSDEAQNINKSLFLNIFNSCLFVAIFFLLKSCFNLTTPKTQDKIKDAISAYKIYSTFIRLKTQTKETVIKKNIGKIASL